jgi:hypothetical protein
MTEFQFGAILGVLFGLAEGKKGWILAASGIVIGSGFELFHWLLWGLH